jgi:2-keto-4-pentenoate hydratase/2-oxohepta-3-ene-1,7-dioic acid hydratase in catechol pathway
MALMPAGFPADRAEGGERAEGVSMLPPFCGSKVLGLAYNFKSLVGVREVYDEPLFFLKSPTSVCGQDATIPYPRFAEKVWVEVELVVVIGRRCRDASIEEARNAILGFGIGSDITAQNLYGRDHHLARSKALDGFAPMAPEIHADIDVGARRMTTEINGKLFQDGDTSDRILGDAEAVSLVSRYVTLDPGDVIMTGTPANAMNSLVRPGDSVRHIIDGIGELRFRFS